METVIYHGSDSTELIGIKPPAWETKVLWPKAKLQVPASYKCTVHLPQFVETNKYCYFLLFLYKLLCTIHEFTCLFFSTEEE